MFEVEYLHFEWAQTSGGFYEVVWAPSEEDQRQAVSVSMTWNRTDWQTSPGEGPHVYIDAAGQVVIKAHELGLTDVENLGSVFFEIYVVFAAAAVESPQVVEMDGVRVTVERI